MGKRFLDKYGKWAVVTGASDGIGRRVAQELAERGLNVLIVARRQQELETLREDIKAASNVDVAILALDVSAPGAMAKLAELTDGLDVGLFAAIAGFGTSGAFVQSTLSKELNMLDVNCKCVVEQIHHFTRRFVQQKRGGIILMGSLVGFQGTPQAATYAATKGFVQTFAEGLHFELKPHGVDVLSAAPGPVASGFADRADMRMGSAATPQQVARAIVSDLGHTVTSRPGFLSKFLGYSLAMLPRVARVRIMHVIMGGFTRHQKQA